MSDERQILSEPSMLRELRRAIKAAGSIAAFSRQHKLAVSTVYANLDDSRPVTPMVARKLGYERLWVYRRTTKS